MDLREFKKSKKREKLLMKQLQQEKINEKFSEWEELNMGQEIHPISHYINDREEMIKQMFNVISERQLMKMLPPGLKGMSVEELQADCLIQLVGMSKKRIMAILEGRELDFSSESPSESDLDGLSMEEEPEPVVKVIKHKKSKKASKRTATTTLEDIQKSAVLSSKKVKTKHKVKKIVKVEVTESEGGEESADNDVIDVDIDTTNKDADILPDKENKEHKGKTLLEILELEMRAKAIRALLERENQPEEKKQLNIESKKTPTKEVETNEKVMPTSVEEVVASVEKNSESDLQSTVNEKDSEDIIILDEEIPKIDLTSDNDSPPRATSPEAATLPEDTCTKPTDSMPDKEASASPAAKPTNPTSPTQITNAVDKASTSANWAQRWLDSSKVKKVVSTSRMYTNIRRKLKKSLMLKHKQVEETQQTEEATPEIPIQEFSGSTQEYELLKKLVKKKKSDELISKGNSESNSQDGNTSQLQENSQLVNQENNESISQEQGNSSSNQQEEQATEKVERENGNSESNLPEDSELQAHENSESNVQDITLESKEMSESNQVDNIRTAEHSELNQDDNIRTEEHSELNHKDIRAVENSESHSPAEKAQPQESIDLEPQENIQLNLRECNGSSSHEISETIEKEENCESIRNSEQSLNQGKESSLHENVESNSDEDTETHRKDRSGKLVTSNPNAPENIELNVEDYSQLDSQVIEINSDDNGSSNDNDTEPESDNDSE